MPTDFENLKTGYQNKFIRTNSKMLTQLFGTDDVTPFWVADIDFEIALPITSELKRLVERGIYAYEFDSKGIYDSIASWNQKRHGFELDTQAFVQVPGVLTGIGILLRELTREGDGVLVQTPVYHQFAKVVETGGRKLIKNPLKIVDGRYEMDFDDLENKLKTESIAVILLCNPHNPVGRVWNTSELKRVLELADEYDARVISDEIHSDIVYVEHRFISVGTLGNEKHVSLIGSPAKTFGMQSISNGYIYIRDEQARKQVAGLVDSMYLGHGNAFTTFATIAAFEQGSDWLDEFLELMQTNINWIDCFIKRELPGVKSFPVEGTYQVWLDFRGVCSDIDALKKLLVEKAKLGLTPGSWFDKENSLFMRMNFASPTAKIQDAFESLKNACNS